jgi:hypothetical protein
MTHRAEQIVDALVTLIQAQVEALGAKVYAHRRTSLDPEQDEMPAISVDVGEDQPADWKGLDTLGSAFNVHVTHIATGAREEDARGAIMDLREKTEALLLSHRRAPAGQKLGLTFVYSIQYDGAGELESLTEGELYVAGVLAKWTVAYQLY